MGNSIMKNPQPNFFQNFQDQFNLFTKNPIDFLMKRRINVPTEFQNNPKGLVQNMLNNGQISQEQLNNMMQIAKQAGINLD